MIAADRLAAGADMRGLAMTMVAGAMLAAVPAAADVKAGVDAWAKGDFSRAVEEWRGPAIAGDADAQFNLAQAYKLGRGVPVDPALAESWFRKAAMQGHVQAEDNYGLALFQNDKKADAVPWLEKSVARFEPRAQLVLGTMLFNGDGVKRDYPRAYALMTRASAKGLDSASATLAQMDQYITPADRERGVALARQYETQARAMPPAAADRATRVSDGSDKQQPPAPPPVRVAAVPARPVREAPVRTLPGAPPRPARDAAPPLRQPAAAPTGGWRIQLGAFRDRANAEALWRRVAGRLKGASPSYVAGGGMTRLQADGYPSRAAAANACATAKVAGSPCVVVAP
ncbi:SPOR domain-containing protein [Sphingomonas sp.]|uniref:SPOR domain-containing protein n=1 Tax=Sphingomonas sp. TaxID=28214 RepID=UPI0035BC073C